MIDDLARDILDAKLALEAELVYPLGITCRSYMESWARAGGRMSPWEIVGHREAIERVLLRHYARVMAVMSGQVPADDATIDQYAVALNQAARMRYRAQNQAMHLIRGMERDLGAALASLPAQTAEKALPDLETKKNGSFSTQYLARFKETAKQAWTKLKNRLKAITNVETEAVAEDQRIEWVRQKHANSRIYKTWHNPMDGKERPAHHDAHVTYSEDGITVDQPFIVGGEELMQPGDGSRGASLGNLINCRCWCHYHIIGPNGERIDIPLQTPALPAKRRWRPGDRFGAPTPIRATESVVLSGRTRARIVLGDGRTIASMTQVTPDTVVVRINGRDVGRATFSGNAVTSIVVSQDHAHLDIDGLIRRSVRATNRFLTQRP